MLNEELIRCAIEIAANARAQVRYFGVRFGVLSMP